MDRLLKLESEHWDLTIWANGIGRRSKQLQQVIASRPNAECRGSALRFSPAVKLKSFTLLEQAEEKLGRDCQSLAIHLPLFFENTQYQLEWVFDTGVSTAAINHKLSRIQNGFQFTNSRGLARLFGSVNTGNDVGWLRLPLVYSTDDGEYSVSMSFEVLPTKILMHQDLPAMYAAIDKDYPLWRFRANSATEQEVSSSSAREKFPLMWLAQFEQLRTAFEKALKVIANAPHSRLLTTQNYKQADKIKGRIAPKLAEKIRQDTQGQRFDKRYLVERKVLSIDTPENRFVKHIVTQAKRALEQLHGKLGANNDKPDVDIFSGSYLAQVKSWQMPLQRMLRQPFIKEVGAYKDVNKVSLVLQQKTGYSSVYRIWQDLKLYLNLFDQQAFIGARTIAQIYEVWCFIALRNLLERSLGFIAKATKKAGLVESGLGYDFGESAQDYFEFERDDGVGLKLWHEPTYNKTTKPLKIFTEKQRPDIVLEATFDDGTQAYWLFDAKYRIDTQYEAADDRVPVDAINQMHRYRDAIIYTENKANHDSVQKSRPVAGAFALYPGYFADQKIQKNPYHDAINEVGIGAFALLPCQGGEHAHWLKNYLIEQLGEKSKAQCPQYSTQKSDALYVREASRIPYHGMKQVRYSDLVMTARIGNGRTAGYIESFRAGTANTYHMPVSTFSMRFGTVLVDEVGYLAVASFEDGDKTALISYIWPVVSVNVVNRGDIPKADAGCRDQPNAESASVRYYLFKLGEPKLLKSPLVDVPCAKSDGFRVSMKLIELNEFLESENFAGVNSKYVESLDG